MTSGLWLTFISTLVTTGLIAIASVLLVRRYRSSDMSDRLILVFGMTLAANAALSYAYTKDDIMTVSGIFYGLAAYAAIRMLIGRIPATNHMLAGVLTFVIFTTGTAWAVRSIGIHQV